MAIEAVGNRSDLSIGSLFAGVLSNSPVLAQAAEGLGAGAEDRARLGRLVGAAVKEQTARVIDDVIDESLKRSAQAREEAAARRAEREAQEQRIERRRAEQDAQEQRAAEASERLKAELARAQASDAERRAAIARVSRGVDLTA